MIKFKIAIDSFGCIEKIKATGHSAIGTKGQNIICAAFTVLLRTSLRTIQSEKSITSKANFKQEGSLLLKITDLPESKREWLKGISDNLILGVRDLKKEAPEEISILLKRRD